MRILLPFLLLTTLPAAAQNSIDFHDTIQFHRSQRADTIDNDHLDVTPFPDSTDLDLDCDSVADVRLKCFKTPLPNFPQAHHIVIQPLAGSGVEVLAKGTRVRAFRRDTLLTVDALTGWSAGPELQILYFNVLGGASWSGVAGTDSSGVTDMLLVFRKEEAGTLRYGWIAYDGRSWPARLSVHETAWSGSSCLQTGLRVVREATSFRLCPNPSAGGRVTVETELAKAKLHLSDAMGRSVGIFALRPGRNTLDFGHLHPGIHHLRVLGEDGSPLAGPQTLLIKGY